MENQAVIENPIEIVYDFLQMPDGPPPGWQDVLGKWEIRNGKLTLIQPSIRNESLILLDSPIQGDIRFIIEGCAGPNGPGELSPILCAVSPYEIKLTRNFYSGYCLQFGADHNTQSKICKNGADLVNTNVSLTPGKWYTMEAAKIGKNLQLIVDGNEIAKFHDFIPLAGEYVGLYCWGTDLRIRSIKIISGSGKQKSLLQDFNALYNKGRVRDARDGYLKFIQENPENENSCEAMFLAGRCSLDLVGREIGDREKLGKNDLSDHAIQCLSDAERLFDELIQKHKNPLGYLGKSMAAMITGNFNAEAKILTEACSTNNQSPLMDAIYERIQTRALELHHKHDYIAMSPFIKTLAEKKPNLMGTSIFSIMIAALPDRKTGREIFKNLTAMYATRQDFCAASKVYLGTSYMADGFYDLARDLFHEVVASYPQLTTECRTAMENIADSFFDEGKYDLVEQTCTEILAKYPDNNKVWEFVEMLRGACLINEGKYDDAADILRTLTLKCTSLAVTSEAWVRIADCYMYMGRLDNAIKYYRKVVDDFPGQEFHSVAVMKTSQCHLLQGKTRQAIEECILAGRISNDYMPFILQSMMHWMLGERDTAIQTILLISRIKEVHNIAVAAARTIVQIWERQGPKYSHGLEIPQDVLDTILAPVKHCDRKDVLFWVAKWQQTIGRFESAENWLTVACEYPSAPIRWKEILKEDFQKVTVI